MDWVYAKGYVAVGVFVSIVRKVDAGNIFVHLMSREIPASSRLSSSLEIKCSGNRLVCLEN